MKRVRLSRNTWMNSLINICFSRVQHRFSSDQPLVEGARRHHASTTAKIASGSRSAYSIAAGVPFRKISSAPTRSIAPE